jgi:hypothetical protein
MELQSGTLTLRLEKKALIHVFKAKVSINGEQGGPASTIAL